MKFDLNLSEKLIEVIKSSNEYRETVLEKAIAAIGNGIVITDTRLPDNPIVYVNEAFSRLTGYSKEEIIGQNCRFLQGKESDRVALRELKTAIELAKECYVVLKNYRKDGTTFWNELYLWPVFDREGNLTNFIGIQKDITDRKQQEEAMRSIVEGTYKKVGEKFLSSLTRNLAASLNARYVGIGRIKENESNQLKIIAFWDGEEYRENLETKVIPNLIQTTLERRIYYYQENIVAAFPEDEYLKKHRIQSYWGIKLSNSQGDCFGVLFVMDDKAMVTKKWSESLLKIVATRIRAELERIEAQEALKASQERLSSILDIARDAIISIDSQQKIQIFNQGAEQIFGYTTEEIIGESLDLLFPEYVREIHNQYINKFLRTADISKEVGQRPEILGRRKDGTIFPAEASISELDSLEGKIYTLILRDITETKQAEEKLKRSAFYDSLTQLPNRTLFMCRLRNTIARAKEDKNNCLFAVLFLDFDDFKVINDSLGHEIGDRLLIKIARRLENCLRPNDTLARLGGDEFTILLENLKESHDVIKIAKRIQEKLKYPFCFDGYEIFSNCSIGIAISSPEYEKPKEMLRNADIAMYEAKKLGKGCYAIFNRQMHEIALERLEVENDLRKAIERSEFMVYYQPIICLKTCKTVGFEALIRWKHSEKGLIFPDRFIPIAEETGSIVPMGEWILAESCSQMKLWQRKFPQIQPLTVSVNISGKQLQQPDLIEKIDRILSRTNLDGRQLKLEITESMLMENTEAAKKILTQIRERNILLSLDDFGTGYSSLNYLHHFPIDILKIDRSFVNLIEYNSEKLAIVRAIITLAHTLGIEVIAEGIETVGQLEKLRLLNCEQGQGYYFSKPIDAEKAEEYLRQNLTLKAVS